jgi:hypothetical protein
LKGANFSRAIRSQVSSTAVEGLARVVGEARAARAAIDVEPVVEQEVDGAAVAHRRRAAASTRLASASSAALRGQSTSNTPAAPMPPPMHIVTSTFWRRAACPSISAGRSGAGR